MRAHCGRSRATNDDWVHKQFRSSASITLSSWNALFLRKPAGCLDRAAWLWLLVELAAHLTVLMDLFDDSPSGHAGFTTLFLATASRVQPLPEFSGRWLPLG
jgi:hypothetical protein